MTGDAVLITGVGRRAGLHLARSFLARGVPVIGTYRSRYEALDELEQHGAELYRCDFDRHADIDRLIAAMMAGLAAEHGEEKTVMIDATYLKAHRTATSMAVKKGGVVD